MTTGYPALPEGFRLRRPVGDDAGAVAELKRAEEMARQADSDITVEQINEEWALPRLDLSRDAWLVEEPGGHLAGYAFCWAEAPPGEIVAEQIVDPARRGLGLSELLLDLCETRAGELFRAAASPGDGSLGVWTHESDGRRVSLYERRGFARVRMFLRLDRDLGPAVEEPAWPRGVTVAPFHPGRDEAPVHAAGEEAFRDHFRPSQMDLEEWTGFRFARGDLDPSLWFVAWDGDQVAGAVIAFETPVGGYLDELFVRRPWRGRGVGRALLLQVCGELRRRGHALAYLGVDAENPTGALHLYESVGFRPNRGAFLFFEKTLAARA